MNRLSKVYLVEISALAVGLTVLGGFLAWNLQGGRARIEGQEARHLSAQARIIDANLSYQLRATDRALQTLQEDYRQVLGLKAFPKLDLRIDTFGRTTPGIRTFWVMDREGRVVASNRPALVGQDLKDRTYFQKARQRNDPKVLYVSPPIRNALGTFAIDLERSVRDAQGAFAGLVAAAMDPSYFETLLGSVNDAPDGWASLVHADGTLFLVVPDPKVAPGRNLLYPGSLFSRHRESGRAATVLTGRILGTGEVRMAARQEVRPAGLNMDVPLFVGVTRNLDAVLAPWRRELMLQFGLLGLFGLATGGAALANVRRHRLLLKEAVAREDAQNDQMRLFFDRQVVGMALSLPNQNWLRVNDRLCQMLGYTREELLRMTWVQLTHPDDRDRDKAAFKRMLDGETDEYKHRKRYVRKDGTFISIELTLGCVRLPGGAIDYFLGVMNDISEERKEVEAIIRKISTAVEQSPVSVVITDTRGVIEYVNPSFTAVTGYTLAEAIGQNPSLLKSGLVDQALYEAMWRTVLSGQVWRGEFHNRKKDGELFWANAVVAPIRDDQGTITNYIAITEDTTERKKAEDALRANEARFRSVFENTPIGLSEQDLSGVKARFDGFREQGITELRAHLEAHPRDLWELAAQVRILQANGTCLGLFGAPTQAGFAEAYPRIFGEGCLPVFLDEMAGLYGGSLVLESGIRRCRLEGKDLDLQVTLSVVPGHEGDLARVLMAFVDQTEKVASEEENLRLDRELSHLQRLESLGRLSSGVAHDMNNVLMVIMAVGDRLKLREDADASLVQSAEYLLQTAARGRDLVKGLRDFSRKELETTRLLDLNDLVATEAELLRHTTLSRIRIDLDLAEGLPSMLGDANGIANAIMNLAVNAFDAMPLGGRIGLSTRDLGDGFIELAVTDDGEGMPPEVQARALEPFYTTKPAGKGTGLGLSQVFGTMKAHGGAMSLTSVPGEGTRVALTFPVPRETRPGAPADAGLPRVPRRNLEIMLVDDEALVLRTCTLLLQDLGHGVQPAGSGLECLRLLKAGNPFDLVVLDVNMPGMDGIETMSRIRLLRPDLPVLFCSGHFDDRIPAILARFPEVRMLEKPFDVAAFDQVLVDWF